MKYSSSALACAALASGVSAFPQYGSANLDKRQGDDHHFEVPAGALRAPCPGMNTLANHGYINRMGRNIRAVDVQQGFLNAFGFDPSITTPGSNNAINLCSTQTGRTCDTFNLDVLNQPHQIEHDGSMTRLDAEMRDNMNANNHVFDQSIFDMTLAIIGDQDHINATTAETVRLRRFEQAMQQDAPGWFVRNDGGSLAEHGFTITCMNDQSRDNPAANLNWVKYWWQNERLPTEVGWKKPNPTIDQGFFNRVVNSVSAASTYKNAPQTRMSSSSTTAPPTSSTKAGSSGASTTTGPSGASSGASSGATSGASSGGSSAASSGGSAPGYGGSSGGSSMGSSAAPSATGKMGSMTNKPASFTTPAMSAGPGPSSDVGSALASATSSEHPSAVSSAAAKATQDTGNGGDRPALNGYAQDHPPTEWKHVALSCQQAVIKVQVEVVKLLKGGYAGATAALGGAGYGSGSYGSGGSGSGSGSSSGSGSGSSGSGSGAGSGSGSGSGSGGGSYGGPPANKGSSPEKKKTKTVVVTATTTKTDCTCPTY